MTEERRDQQKVRGKGLLTDSKKVSEEGKNGKLQSINVAVPLARL